MNILLPGVIDYNSFSQASLIGKKGKHVIQILREIKNIA